jgi:pyruvate/2-oxoglutarate/acetoin dehydrogenase E1 component
MRRITYREALRQALREEMRRDVAVFLLGEDIGRYWGGAFKLKNLGTKESGTRQYPNQP